MILPISKLPAPILRTHTADLSVENIKKKTTQQLMDDMIETMYSADGIGIAAVQVGSDLRMCIIGKEADKKLTEDLVLVNPSWEKLSKKKTSEIEGCLSIPGVAGTVSRWKDIRVKALDRNGKPLDFEAHNYFARVIQHEVDHLNGVLFIDTATRVQELKK